VPASVRIHRWRGVAAVTLASGELAATFIPEMNLLGASLRLGGEEFLASPGGVGAYRRVRTTGLPAAASRVSAPGSSTRGRSCWPPSPSPIGWRRRSTSTAGRCRWRPRSARTYDDLFELTGDRRLGIQHGGRRLSVLFGAGYPYAQVYAPPGAGFACLEPMTAPTDALVAGGYPVVRPGESFTARFSIRPERIRPGTA
jgi:hypothetical protein